MAEKDNWRPDLDYYRVPRVDPGWIYAVKTENKIKIGKTTDPTQARMHRIFIANCIVYFFGRIVVRMKPLMTVITYGNQLK